MSDEIREAMEVVSVRILEDAAFLFADPLPPSDAPASDWNPDGAEIRWDGPSQGVMRIWAPRALQMALAANMLGLEDSDPTADTAGTDALREILNMVAGNTLTEAWGPGPVFQLTIPERAEPETFHSDSGEGFWVSADGHPVLFWSGTP